MVRSTLLCFLVLVALWEHLGLRSKICIFEVVSSKSSNQSIKIEQNGETGEIVSKLSFVLLFVLSKTASEMKLLEIFEASALVA